MPKFSKTTHMMLYIKDLAKNLISTIATINKIVNSSKKSSNLKKLNVRDPRISGIVLVRIIKDNSNLEEIDIRYCRTLYDLELQDLGELPNLKTLIAGYSILTGQSLAAILRNAPNIEEIYIKKCHQIRNVDFQDLGNLSKLKILHANYSNITGTSLGVILKSAANIQEIDIQGCKQIQELNLQDLGHLPNLKKFNARDSNITGQSLAIILKNSPNIEEIYIENCSQIHDVTLQNLGRLPKLYKFDKDDSYISGDVLASIIHQSTKLQHKHELLLDCLNKFTEYHRATGFIVRLIIKQINLFSCDGIKKICQSKCSFPNKIEVLNAFIQNDLTKKPSEQQANKIIQCSNIIDIMHTYHARSILFENGRIMRAFVGSESTNKLLVFLFSEKTRPQEGTHLYKFYEDFTMQANTTAQNHPV
jgi:hypothetical protein